jgi:hypothetical protein
MRTHLSQVGFIAALKDAGYLHIPQGHRDHTRRDPGTPAGPQQELVTRHYLLTEGQRDRAVGLGAQVITAREADKLEGQRAAMRGEASSEPELSAWELDRSWPVTPLSGRLGRPT